MMTIFGGTLIRHGQDDWRWSDGTHEPRVYDLSPSAHFNFRCRSYSGGGTYVEVLLSIAHSERDVLGWVLDGVASGEYRQDLSGDHTGPMHITETGVERMRIEPGEDPLLGNEPIIHRRAIPRVALVPIAEWDSWAKAHPYGATWDVEVQDDLLRIARSLGASFGQ